MVDYVSMLLPRRRVVALWRTPVVNLRDCVVMPATQRAAIMSWFQGAPRTVVQSRRVSQLREWLWRVSAGSIAYLPPHLLVPFVFLSTSHYYTSSFFLSFFFSFFFIWSISWLPEEVDVTRFFCNHKTGKFRSNLVGNLFNIAVLHTPKGKSTRSTSKFKVWKWMLQTEVKGYNSIEKLIEQE
jgi:hypothetical protein